MCIAADAVRDSVCAGRGRGTPTAPMRKLWVAIVDDKIYLYPKYHCYKFDVQN